VRALILGATLSAVLASASSAEPFLCVYPAVHDGDTWTCRGGQRVRLWGVNAAELRDPGGAEAKRALNHLIAGKVLTCVPKGRSYDRTVALCTVDGHDVAEEMVRQRQAVDWPKYSRGRYAR